MQSRDIVLIPLLLIVAASICFGQQQTADMVVSDVEEQALRPTLDAFVRKFGKRKSNHVLIVALDNGRGARAIYGFWKEDESILLLGRFDDSREANLLWLHRKARIDLNHDVVADEESVGTSTYLVHKEWADRIINACLRSGREVVINLQRRAKTRDTE